jgi:hypothetical protein
VELFVLYMCFYTAHVDAATLYVYSSSGMPRWSTMTSYHCSAAACRIRVLSLDYIAPDLIYRNNDLA